MQKSTFDTIGSIIIFSVWGGLAITGVREYLRLMKHSGVRPFMSKKDIAALKNTSTDQAIERWKKMSRRLFLIWLLAIAIHMTISIVIDSTVGFK